MNGNRNIHGPNDGLFMQKANSATDAAGGCFGTVMIFGLVFLILLMMQSCEGKA